MINKKHFLKINKFGFVLGAVLLAVLTENAVHAGGVSIGIDVTPPVVVVAPPVVAVQDDYVYYPDYDVYYNSSRHQYVYLHAGLWISAPEPGVSLPALLASPSVNMDWHDSPANHHKEMLEKYPKNWKPADVRQDVHQDQKEDQNITKPDHDKKPPGQ